MDGKTGTECVQADIDSEKGDKQRGMTACQRISKSRKVGRGPSTTTHVCRVPAENLAVVCESFVAQPMSSA